MLDFELPDSPRSTTSSDPFGSPPKLDPATLALLDSFFSARVEEENRFNALAEEVTAQVAGLSVPQESEHEEEKKMMSIEEFNTTFREDWQLSQFW